MQFWRPGDAHRPRNDGLLAIGSRRTALSDDRKLEILYALERKRSVVLQGDSGTHVSKEIPQALVTAGWSCNGKCIAVALARQVSVISTAVQVAQEKGLDESHLGGDYVGFAVHSNVKRSSSTKIAYFTNRALLQTVQREPLLSSVSVVLVDNFHERSIAVDVLLGLLKKIQKVRQELRIIVVTASTDADRVRSFLGRSHTAVIQLLNTAYPVTILHSKEPVEDYLQAALETVKDAFVQWNSSGQPKGANVLTFVKGAEEAERLCDMVNNWFANDSHELTGAVARKKSTVSRTEQGSKLQLLAAPLYAELGVQGQMIALDPKIRRERLKVIVATSIAEMSVTVEGISTVIDCGFERTDVFNPKMKTTFVSTVPISKESAHRRATRAGLNGSGTCIRLYTQGFLKSSMLENRPPAILRCELTEMMLTLKAIGIANISGFDFVDQPTEALVVDALERLFYLGAITKQGSLTPDIGARMSVSRLGARMAKCLLVGESYGVGRAVAAVAAMLEVRHVIFNSKKLRRNSRASFAVAEGDVLTLLNVWRRYVDSGLSESWCKEHGVNVSAMQRAKRSFSQIVKSHLAAQSKAGKFAAAHKAIGLSLVECVCRSVAAGYFENAAMVEPNGSYFVALSGRKVYLHTQSVLFKRMPKWVVYVELTQRSESCEMREVTVVQPQWIAEYAPELFESLYNRPEP